MKPFEFECAESSNVNHFNVVLHRCQGYRRAASDISSNMGRSRPNRARPILPCAKRHFAHREWPLHSGSSFVDRILHGLESTMREMVLIDKDHTGCVRCRARTARRSQSQNRALEQFAGSDNRFDQELATRTQIELRVDQGRRGDVDQERFACRFGKLVPHGMIGVTKGTASIVKLGSVLRAGLADVCHAYGIFFNACPTSFGLRAALYHNSVAIGSGRTRRSPISTCRHRRNTLPMRSVPFTTMSSTTPDWSVARSIRSTVLTNADNLRGRASTNMPVRHYSVYPASSHRTRNYCPRKFWKEGYGAIWDTRAIRHYAINDYDDQYRVSFVPPLMATRSSASMTDAVSWHHQAAPTNVA